MTEIWKEINGYEGLYEISSLGRVKSLERTWITGKGASRKHPCIIMKPSMDGFGYLQVLLRKNGKVLTKHIHRLVAEAFISNSNNLPQINHKDENKSNNCVDNLEWCDAKYNNNYGSRIIRSNQKKIKLIEDVTTGEINDSEYFAKKFNVNRKTIQGCANPNDHFHKNVKGHMFRYKEV